MLQSVSQPRQKDVTLLCHSGRKCEPARLEKSHTRTYKRSTPSLGRRNALKREVTVMFSTANVNKASCLTGGER